MSKYNLILFTFFIGSTLTFAQNPWHTISGSIYDIDSSEPVPYAQIAIKRGAELLDGTTSDANGSFEVKRLPEGNLILQISFIGFETYEKEITINKSVEGIDLGKIGINPASVNLNTLEVNGLRKTSSTKLDRKTYTTSDFETTTGGNAVDVLNMLPSVSVSPDGVVSVRGATDFMVYLNGKPTQMEASVLLAQLQSDAIESVDVITVPSAKFDSQGKGGVINITTKRSALNGLSIIASGMYGGAPWGNYTGQYSNFKMNDERYNGNLNVAYNKDRLSLYGGLGYNLKKVNGNRDGDARIRQTAITNEAVYKHMVASGNRPEWYENITANAGVQYKLSETSQLSASYNYGYRKEGRSAFYVYHNFYADKDKQPVDVITPPEEWIYNPNTDTRYGIFQSGNIDYSQSFANNSTLDLSLLYEHSGLSRELDNENYGFDHENDAVDWGDPQLHYRQTDNTPLEGFRFSADYEKPLANDQLIGIGFQPQLVTTEGEFTYDTLNVSNGEWGAYESLENGINLKRNIYAGYINYEGMFNKFSLNAGVRLEYTDQVLNLDKPVGDILNDYGDKTAFLVQQLDWFPTLHLGYEASVNDNIIFAATRRINRPAVKEMAPFLYRRHLEVYLIGDPELKPEYVLNFELGYTRTLGSNDIGITGFYRGTDNAIFRVNTVYDENGDGFEDVLIRSYTNSGTVKAMGAELNANLQAGTFAKFFVGGSLYHYQVMGDVFGYSENNQSLNWSLKGNMNLFLTKELKFTLDFNVQSATVTAQGNNEMFYMSNTALSYSPKKAKAWTFQAKVLDILSSNIKGLDTRAFDEGGNELFYQATTYYRQGPIAQLNISYAFNKASKNTTKAKKTFGEEEF